MPLSFADADSDAIAIDVITPDGLPGVLDGLTAGERAWVEAQQFTAALGQHVLLGNAEGGLGRVLAGFGTPQATCQSRGH